MGIQAKRRDIYSHGDFIGIMGRAYMGWSLYEDYEIPTLARVRVMQRMLSESFLQENASWCHD